jgi:hypothetical protein
MIRLILKDVREAFARWIAIPGGAASVILLPDSLSGRYFERYLDCFFTDLEIGGHLILGISETPPPGTPSALTRRCLCSGPGVGT